MKTADTREVCIAYVSPGSVSTLFHDSLAGLLQRFTIGARISKVSGPGLVRARNEVVKAFLATDCKYLWMLDSDMGFEPELILEMLDFADRYPVLGALTFGMDGDGTVFPVIRAEHEGQIRRIDSYPTNALVPCVTGTGCLMVQRQVFETMQKEYPEPYPWFQHTARNGQAISEDVEFCLRAKELGFQPFVHTGLRTLHKKSLHIGEAHYRELEDA